MVVVVLMVVMKEILKWMMMVQVGSYCHYRIVQQFSAKKLFAVALQRLCFIWWAPIKCARCPPLIWGVFLVYLYCSYFFFFSIILYICVLEINYFEKIQYFIAFFFSLLVVFVSTFLSWTRMKDNDEKNKFFLTPKIKLNFFFSYYIDKSFFFCVLVYLQHGPVNGVNKWKKKTLV